MKMTQVRCGFEYCEHNKKRICQAEEIKINVCHDAFKYSPFTEEEFLKKVMSENKDHDRSGPIER